MVTRIATKTVFLRNDLVIGLLEERADVVQRGRVVVLERVVLAVVEIAALLENGEDHPRERQSREDHEEAWRRCRSRRTRPALRPSCERRAAVLGRPLPDGVEVAIYVVSARRAIRSIKIATATSTGKRKRAIAAPWARSLPPMPL